MRTAVLRGREHALLGAIAAEAEGPAAISLSRGGAGKTYDHVDPNEDVAAFAVGGAGVLLLVADGHGGCEAAEVAVSEILAHHAPRFTGGAPGPREGWEAEARSALLAAHRAIVLAATPSVEKTSRTTLCLALARPGDDFLGYAAIGDSHLFQLGDEVSDLNVASGERTPFLGSAGETPDTLTPKLVIGCESLAGTRALVLATDGLSERGIGVDDPEGEVAAVLARAAEASPELRPLVLARGIADEALAAHRRHRAGDNIGCAVLWR